MTFSPSFRPERTGRKLPSPSPRESQRSSAWPSLASSRTAPGAAPQPALTARADERLCVMFLHDLRAMQARLRTENSLRWRMSAAVAHEIRNPLAAITQANALLEEDLH